MVISLCPFCRVWSVRYNHFHDQLVLSASSDSRVVLNNVVTLSSEPFGHLVEEEDNSEDEEEVKEGLVKHLINKKNLVVIGLITQTYGKGLQTFENDVIHLPATDNTCCNSYTVKSY